MYNSLNKQRNCKRIIKGEEVIIVEGFKVRFEERLFKMRKLELNYELL